MSFLSKIITKKAMGASKVKENFEAAWEAHAQVFGDIMNPAFEGDEEARLRLAAALNCISRNEIAEENYVKALDCLGRHPCAFCCCSGKERVDARILAVVHQK